MGKGMDGTVFKVQRFCTHDGPGIRTTVFFKGCNLRCWWCHNPESWTAVPVLMFNSVSCIGCGKCAAACGYHHFDKGIHTIDRDFCTYCGKCTAECPTDALSLCGGSVSVSDLLSRLEKDKVFYEKTGGGITCSGGECLLQPEFLENLLRLCKTKLFHTAVDTAGDADFSVIERILPYTDLFLYDFKCISSGRHKEGTGVDNQRILHNLSELLTFYPQKVRIRIPIIPGFNDSENEIQSMASFLSRFNAPEKIELIPYHRLGEIKLKFLGYPLLENMEMPDQKTLQEFQGILEKIPIKERL
jgi:pyruvate formate lyase activating enzyme